jgi:3-phenylpropionate/trans-cinnamate dioxygenase ferredoxin reductase component
MTRQPFVIVGGGSAGAHAAAQLRKDGFDGAVVLFGDEPVRPYDRPPLSKEYLRGDATRETLSLHGPTFYQEHDIDLRTSVRIQGIDAGNRHVLLDDGTRLGYERLLLATGAEPRRLDVPGADLQGVMYLRTPDDADAIRTAALAADQTLVIGGGWIGAEVAASLRQLGRDVTLVVPGTVPLERVLGPEVGAIYRDLHIRQGVQVVAGERITAILGAGRVEGVELGGGERRDSDLVVVGIGAQPRVGLASDAGLDVEDGVVVDERLETSVPGIFAAGDVARAWHPALGARIRVEHWDNARRQGRAAARNMMGMAERYVRLPYFYSDQFDLSMEYVGQAAEWDEVVLRGDPGEGHFVAFWLRGGRALAGMNANTPKVNETIRTLVASGRHLDTGRLADPGVPLDDIEALSAS